MNRPARTLWALVVIAGATAVGITTHEPGFVIITFVGGLWLPRILGLRARRGRMWSGRGCAEHTLAGRRLDDRLGAWHRHAHGDAGGRPPATSAATRT